MSLPPWDQLTFTFRWEPWVHTIRQCSTLKVEFSTDLGPGFVANPTPAPPYTVIVLAGGYRPLIMAVGNIGQNGTFEWVVNLPLGPQYILAMKDSAGYSGGSSLLWTMTTGNDGCPLDPSPITPSTLSFTRIGSAQCGEINYVINNGTSPYRVEIIPEIRQRRTLYFSTNKFGFIMDLPTGLNVYIAITDAAGNSGVDQLMTVGTSSDNSCLKAAGTVSVGRVSTMYTGSGVSMPTATKVSTITDYGMIPSGNPPGSNNKSTGGTNTVPIVAGIVAVVAAISFIILILSCIYRRRRGRVASQPQPPAGIMQQQVNLPQYPHTHYTTPILQYSSITAPQIQTLDPHMYAPAPYPGNHFTPMPPDGAYTQDFANLTTHIPRPRSYQTGQSVLLDGKSSPDQSPYTFRYSQGSFPGSGNSAGGVRLSPDTAITGAQFDNNGRTMSPSLPPGALPSPSSALGPSEQWVPQPPGTPGNSSIYPPLGSPRSESATVPPYYEPLDEKPQAQQPA
ncbi:unnamed protein product [Rhizoctonia solani]|uniref:Transmembrane protein n=1 Tax=Rhizoctonia solani TaxID=456999 RepID=A0A8H3HNA0_9AGAM|nr:unnamed protein product [Rhizoctonia solani]